MKNYRVLFRHSVPMISDPFLMQGESEDEVRMALSVVGETLRDFEIVEIEEVPEYQIPLPLDDDEEDRLTGDNVIPFNKNTLN